MNLLPPLDIDTASDTAIDFAPQGGKKLFRHADDFPRFQRERRFRCHFEGRFERVMR